MNKPKKDKHALARAKKANKSKSKNKPMLKPFELSEGMEFSVDPCNLRNRLSYFAIEHQRGILGEGVFLDQSISLINDCICIALKWGEIEIGGILFDEEVIYALVVSPDYSRCGYGRALVNFAKEVVSRIPGNDDFLHVVGSLDSIPFWESIGSRAMRTRPSGDIDFYLPIGDFNLSKFTERKKYIDDAQKLYDEITA